MASRLLRHGLRPACRLHLRRPFRETRALFFAATSPDRASSQQAPRIPHAPGTAAWGGTRAWSTVVAGTSADVVGGRVGTSRLPSAMSTLFGDGCCWRGGGVALYRAPSATRSLSSGRSTSSSQKLTNKAIKSRTVMLVVEKPDGSKETTILSRKQALAAAVAANLDLVQVNAKTSPVVCKLMDFKREEYRLKRQSKATSRRVQKTKEIHMKGLIGDHDFERKVSGVKKYLERGDMVKVVMEAQMSLLKRSLNCLEDLQTKFEEQMDHATVVMKASGGGNGLTRREVLCTPKKVKVPAREKRLPQEAGAAAGKVYMPPLNGGVDQSALLELVGAGEGQGSHLDSVSELSDADSESAEGLENSDEDSGEESEEDSDEEEEEEGEDAERSDDDKKESSKKDSLDLDDALLWEMEQNPDYGEEVDLAAEWELSQARKKGLRAEGDASGRANDGSVKRGGADRKTGKRRGNDGGSGGGGGGSGRAAGEEWGGDSRRERPAKRKEGGRREGGRGGAAGRGRGGGGRGGAGGVGYGGRGTPQTSSGGGRSGSFQWGEGRGGFPGRGRGDGGRLGGRGAGDGGESRTPPPPVRSTPYKWGTSKGEGQGATAAAAVVIPAVSQPLRERNGPPGAEAEAPSLSSSSSGGGGGDADGDRGGAFRAKFGGGGAVAAAAAATKSGDGGDGQQQRSALQMPAVSVKDCTSGASTDRFRFPAQSAAATTAATPIAPSRDSLRDSRGDSDKE